MNKTIYILWFQGFNNAPDIVKKCVESWKYYNQDWNIILLDNTNLSNYIKIEDYIDMSNKKINFTALSDVVRLILLNTYGGLWVDSTTFCNKPLNEWLHTYTSKEFFAFDKPGPDRLLSTWFIYSEKEHYLTKTWLELTVKYYKIYNEPHTYYWVHYLFSDLYNSDNIFKEVWDSVPKLSANNMGPHYLQNKGMFNKIKDEIKSNIDNKITPFYKLTYKCDFTLNDISLNLYYLYSTISQNPKNILEKSKI
jgi:hypothetical protein